MPKITDANYQLPEIIPLQWVRTLEGGANKPIVILGADRREQQSSYFVLKYRGAERMDEAACRREILAAFMAAEMDIAVPEPVVIKVDQTFVETVPADLRDVLSARALGLNFGSRYIRGNATFKPSPMLPPELLQSAARIFAFDVLLKNGDRRPDKPNAFVADGNIYVYDHELSFGFLFTLPFLLSANAWELNATDVSSAQNHLFYPSLHRSRSVNWEAAISTLHHLTPQFWDKVGRLIPPEWRDPNETNRIRQHIESVQLHINQFTAEIWNKLMV